ncbi:MAG TPA: 16S rRNA (cytosine(1402)-N(4))-methyltransferase RsmH [Gemmataceae bacterium]|nr:16S rRNA (cytosine(1402)-N(4))-methyltransferase RsmH [Gemmataceae bacterium]
MKSPRRSTVHGQHRPVMLGEALAALDPQSGQIAVDCTVGFAGHAVEFLSRVGSAGKLIGIDFDAEHLPQTQARLEAVGKSFSLHQGNFAGLANILAAEGMSQVDMILADLGMSSMQVDAAERGFSYNRDGILDMRMDRSRGRTAAQVLADIAEADLCRALQEFGDEPEAATIAKAIVAARKKASLTRTGDLVRIIMEATGTSTWRLHPRPGKWVIHPAARTFQALRMLVNRELANLENLLRVTPTCLKPGGRAAIISFHSGEDRLVKAAFRDGLRAGIYDEAPPEPIRASYAERGANPRSRSAKLRWARRASR